MENNELDVFDIGYLVDKNVHFIGICGVSMRVLARMTLAIARRVTGSDRVYSPCMEDMTNIGINCYIGTDIDVVRCADVVVYSSAVPPSDSELCHARSLGIPTIERGKYLGIVSRMAEHTIAIAGTHGKSTTTAILGNIFGVARADYTLHLGAEMVDETPFFMGRDYFVTEACEYRRSFLHLDPYIAGVTSIDYDHPDEYSSMGELLGAFDTFMANSDIVIAHDSIVTRHATITYGASSRADYRIESVYANSGRYSFDIVSGENITHIDSPLYGRFNVDNVAMAYAIADTVGIDRADIVEGIETFRGLKRRYEYKGNTSSGARVISDYAHHPEEIRRVIDTAHECTHGRVIVAFEPHTYSRTKSLIDDFLTAFYWADSLILLPTFPAREEPSDGLDTFELISRLKEVKEYPLYFASYNKACSYLIDTATKGDTILVLGAGSIDHLADMLVGDSDI